MTLVHSMVAGGDCIDDVDVLRAGETEGVLGASGDGAVDVRDVPAGVHFGHVRQLDAWSEFALSAAWAAGAGPGGAPMTIDIDSTICETYGYAKQAATFGYTKRRGYHPLLATRADTGEVLHVRFRKGSANTGRGAERFVRELIGRVRRAGATGPLRIRADSGFWSDKVIEACRDHGVGYSITVRPGHGGEGGDRRHRRRRLAADRLHDRRRRPSRRVPPTATGTVSSCRRTRIIGAQPELFDNWRHHAFITDQDRQRRRSRRRPPGPRRRSSSPSATSKKAPGSTTARRVGSTPTAPGPCSPPSPTT